MTHVSVVKDYVETREIILLWKSKKIMIKVTKNVIWHFRKLCVHMVVDFAKRTRAEIVVDYMYTMSASHRESGKKGTWVCLETH